MRNAAIGGGGHRPHEYLPVFARLDLKESSLATSKQPLAVCEHLGPAENANGVPQSGRPKRVCLHERIDDVWAIGLDHPQPTGGVPLPPADPPPPLYPR